MLYDATPQKFDWDDYSESFNFHAVSRRISLTKVTRRPLCSPYLFGRRAGEDDKRMPYNISLHHTSDDSISGFQFRYDMDTILAKYRDIDTISIFCKCVRYTSARTVTRHEQGSMVYLDNNNGCLSDS